ncbi:MAG TPA: hypothetical protein VLT86_13175 [Vicinamibacterales bacterium]|nr:hypothetical protein [Vicinamibacterales bacterium]
MAILSGPAAALAGQGPSSGPAPSQQHDMGQPAGAAQDYPTLHIAGFGDVDYSQTKQPEGPRGFSLGQFVLHMTSELSPRVTFFGELSFTARSDAGTGTPPAAGFNAEIERMILRFDESDRLKISFGRYHTPINWWNTAFHHGQWLQTTITRPEMIQFGGKFLPVHFVGALVEGAAPAGGWNVNYQAGFGNGRGQVISRAGDAGDNNGFRATLLNFFSKPDRFFGLQFGGSFYFDKITLPDTRDFAERIVAGHVVWQKEDPELIAEVAAVRHQQVDTALVTWSHAYYIQAAYRLPQFDRLWKPYYRFEHIGVNPMDPVFTTVPNLNDGSTLGIRFDASQFVALKGEFRTWRRASSQPRNYGGFFQVCFTF